ncbi:MAG TPA: biotin/lipoyl-containing protein, partial [Candidatus Eisenbacteria bacterium]|nr:biotin/lipoyl-containing protein [Candidatus Eisenbacteria bacterium]
MTIPLKIPEVGESITEVTIGDWLKSEGDAVERDEEIVVIETEKATVEISAPQAGTLVRILKPSGETARVGDVIGEIDESARAERPPEREIRGAQSVERAVEDDGSKARPPSRGPVAAHEPGVTRPARGEESVSTERRPEVKSEARGPVRAPGRPLAEEPRKGAAQAEPSPLEPRRREAIEEPAKGPTVSSPATAAREETVVRMTPLRRRIAERLVESQKTTAHLTTFNEIDMTEVLALRERY